MQSFCCYDRPGDDYSAHPAASRTARVNSVPDAGNFNVAAPSMVLTGMCATRPSVQAVQIVI
eukprot:6204971-Pleurochrysis_carterae.AAC.2